MYPKRLYKIVWINGLNERNLTDCFFSLITINVNLCVALHLIVIFDRIFVSYIITIHIFLFAINTQMYYCIRLINFKITSK